jgi:uncharacterized membrane protein YesL
MMNIKDNFLKAAGIFWSFLFLFLISAAIEGFVFSYLWLWFVTPLGVPEISLIHAIGMCALFDFISYHYYDYKKSEEVPLATSISYILIRPLVVFIVGYLLKLFM